MAVTEVTAYAASDGSLHRDRVDALKREIDVLLQAPTDIDKIMKQAPQLVEALSQLAKLVPTKS